MPDVPLSDAVDSASVIRRRIGEIIDELSAIPRDCVAERAPLVAERAGLSVHLRVLCADDDVARRWAARAPFRPPDSGVPYIGSRGEAGGNWA